MAQIVNVKMHTVQTPSGDGIYIQELNVSTLFYDISLYVLIILWIHTRGISVKGACVRVVDQDVGA